MEDNDEIKNLRKEQAFWQRHSYLMQKALKDVTEDLGVAKHTIKRLESQVQTQIHNIDEMKGKNKSLGETFEEVCKWWQDSCHQSI